MIDPEASGGDRPGPPAAESGAVSIRSAGGSDLPFVGELLACCGLPTVDLEAGRIVGFVIAESQGDSVGTAGVELYPPVALLRSVAVVRAQRRRGIGAQLVAEVERRARARGVRVLYLLTTSAEHFFAGLGYAQAERADAPAAIRATREFAALCPATAVLMHRRLA